MDEKHVPFMLERQVLLYIIMHFGRKVGAYGSIRGISSTSIALLSFFCDFLFHTAHFLEVEHLSHSSSFSF